MNVAVLTLTRDRLAYTQHTFDRLHDHAGTSFHHYVLDQGSQDGTAEWLRDQYKPHALALFSHNIGISRGMNVLLDLASGHDYDAIVKFDNDCELVQPDTLRDVVALSIASGDLLSPRICGLNNPPHATGEYQINGDTILDVPQIGGIFIAAPAALYADFRYAESNPPWGMDDVEVCRYARSQGVRCGYVKRLEAWHFETTAGQHARFPAYFERTANEGKGWVFAQ